jgi:S-adenosylmethionine/arginine decarboxylase-like enzyme
MINTGTHFYGKIYSKSKLLSDLEQSKIQIIRLIDESGLKNIGLVDYKFGEFGYTFAIILAESHFTIHTWPEDQYLMLDLFVCNHNNDNSELAEKLFHNIINLFDPFESIINSIKR